MRFGKIPWPLPAVLVWLSSWGVFYLTQSLGIGFNSALLMAVCLGAVLSTMGQTWWRKSFIAGGFPVSFLILFSFDGLMGLPAWFWLIPLCVLLLIYPIRSWQDAPLFPTPANTLSLLSSKAPLPLKAKVMDAGCGLGHGLDALRIAYPQADLTGVEWSRLLCWVCQMRCPWAKISRGNIWEVNWSDFNLVYVFQRPESMQRAANKAMKELKPGAWMVSLEFEADALVFSSQFHSSGGKIVWLYQAPLKFKNVGEIDV
jgi:hypothetical protein